MAEQRPEVVVGEVFDVDVDAAAVVVDGVVAGRRRRTGSDERKRLEVEHAVVVGPRAEQELGHPRVAAELVATPDGEDGRLDPDDAAVRVDDRLNLALVVRSQPVVYARTFR